MGNAWVAEGQPPSSAGRGIHCRGRARRGSLRRSRRAGRHRRGGAAAGDEGSTDWKVGRWDRWWPGPVALQSGRRSRGISRRRIAHTQISASASPWTRAMWGSDRRVRMEIPVKSRCFSSTSSGRG